MPKYRVVAYRTTEYSVIADDPEHAKDEMMEGGPTCTEVHGDTHEIESVRVCPICGDDLLPKTTRKVVIDDVLQLEEPTWCDSCQREVTD